jgi:hypothetical protein
LAAFSRLKVLGVITVMNGGTSASLDHSPWPNPQNTPLAVRQGRCPGPVRHHPPAWPPAASLAQNPQPGPHGNPLVRFCQPGGPGSSTYN